MLAAMTVLLGGFSIVSASWIYKLRGQSISLFRPESNPFAWDCASYNFNIDSFGQVTVNNASTRSESTQMANVYINDVLAQTFSVPALSPGQSAVLGTVGVPDGGFTWKVDGSLDCSDSGDTKGCFLSFSIAIPTLTPTPTPTVSPTPTPRPTSTPTQAPTSTVSACSVSFELPHTAICWRDPIQNVPLKYTVHSLPTTGGPFYMQTDWYVASPTQGPHHYQNTQVIQAGQTYTMYADWPGIRAGSNQTVEIHYGINVLDRNKNIVSPNCSDGMDYYWTPYVNCSLTPPPPAGAVLSPTLTPSPTPTVARTCPRWARILRICR